MRERGANLGSIELRHHTQTPNNQQSNNQRTAISARRFCSGDQMKAKAMAPAASQEAALRVPRTPKDTSSSCLMFPRSVSALGAIFLRIGRSGGGSAPTGRFARYADAPLAIRSLSSALGALCEPCALWSRSDTARVLVFAKLGKSWGPGEQKAVSALQNFDLRSACAPLVCFLSLSRRGSIRSQAELEDMMFDSWLTTKALGR